MVGNLQFCCPQLCKLGRLVPSPTAEAALACPEKAPDGANLTEDRLLDGRVRLLQPARGYRAAIDPVLLAAAVAARPAEQVLELGCGTGAALLCLAARRPDLRLEGIELQEAAAALARRSAELCGVADRVTIRTGNLLTMPIGTCDQIFTNPPFHAAGSHSPSPDPGKALSHGEQGADIEDWVRAAARALKPRGTLTLIFPAARIDDLLAALKPRFGGVSILPLWPKAGVPARRVIVRATLQGRSPARLLAGLVLHEADGSFTEAAEAVLRHAGALSWE